MSGTRIERERSHLFTWLGVGLGALMSAAGCQCSEERSGISQLRPEIEVAPSAIDFGDVPTGATAVRTISIANKGGVALHVCVAGTTLAACESASHVEPAGGPFATDLGADASSEAGAWVVDAGGSRELVVRFSPTTNGAQAGSLVLVHDARSPTTIPLTGNGVEPVVTFANDALDFGATTVGQRKTLELVLTNGTAFTAPITIQPIDQASVIFGTEAVTGGDTPAGAAFTGELPGNGTLAIRVFYQPQDEVTDTNVLHVSFCPTCTKDVALTGFGVKPSFTLAPGVLAFGDVELGVSTRRTFRVSNSGRSPLTVRSVALDPASTTDFTPTPRAALPAVLGEGESLDVDVDLVATSAGAKNGQVRIETDAWDDPATGNSETIGVVVLTGSASGPMINVLPPSLSFGTVPPGSVSSRVLLIENAGTAPLSLTGVALSPNDPALSLGGLPAFPTTLDPGASLRATVVYHPTSAGSLSGSIVVTSSDRLHPSVTVPLSGLAGTPTTCALTVLPSQLTFGIVERGRVNTMPLDVRNLGPVDCTLTNVALSGDSSFSLPGTTRPSVVAAGQHVRIDVAYAPTAYGSHSGELTIDSNDPVQPSITVFLSGASAPDQLRVVPSALDFAVVPTMCSSPTRAITLYNTGSSAITITGVFLDPAGSADFVLDPFTTPVVIPAGGSSVVHVHFHPRSSGVQTSALFVAHSASSLPAVVPLTGDGEPNATATDTFQQNATQKVDALFVVDSSASMANNQANLGANFASFIAAADMQGVDYHIAITTTDVCTGVDPDPLLQCDAAGPAGAFVGTPSVLTPQTPNVAALFQQNVQVGTDGSGQERGLEAAYLALSDPLINTTNVGFLRADAALAVIIVSDDDDSRQDGIPGGPNETLVSTARPVDFYVAFFENLKGFDTSMFSLNAIIEPHQGDCNGTGQPVEASGYRYGLVAQATGGEIERICGADWGQSLSQIGLNTFGLKRQFGLSSSPVASSITVTVNGTTVPSGSAWTYDATANAVVFTPGNVPPVQATVTISYPVACLP